MIETWQTFSAPRLFTEDRLVLAVRGTNSWSAYERLRKDDPIWRNDGVRFHGRWEYDPGISRLRAHRDFMFMGFE